MAKLIDLYKEWMEKGTMVPDGDIDNGLCCEIPHDYYETWQLFVPTEKQKRRLYREGFCDAYWASGLKRGHKEEFSAFTPLRQTIVLLICAIHDEL